MNYFDTSALIKRFVDEPGSARVEGLVEKEPTLATSKVAYAEVHSGLARKLREGAFTAVTHRRTSRAFDTDWRAYVRVDLTDEVLTLARDLVQRHPLRGFDAIHLASALRLQRQLAEDIRFIAADGRILAAANSEGLATVDVRS
jgi:predicted nucleic acid-binding protein